MSFLRRLEQPGKAESAGIGGAGPGDDYSTVYVQWLQREEQMRTVLWVVYQTQVPGRGGSSTARNVICEQDEWDALERDNPGRHTLIRAGITNEGEAERLARGTAGDTLRATAKRL
jgi:hypothetical protein